MNYFNNLFSENKKIVATPAFFIFLILSQEELINYLNDVSITINIFDGITIKMSKYTINFETYHKYFVISYPWLGQNFVVPNTYNNLYSNYSSYGNRSYNKNELIEDYCRHFKEDNFHNAYNFAGHLINYIKKIPTDINLDDLTIFEDLQQLCIDKCDIRLYNTNYDFITYKITSVGEQSTQSEKYWFELSLKDSNDIITKANNKYIVSTHDCKKPIDLESYKLTRNFR